MADLPGTDSPRIVVLGLGYVGLPLAVRLAEKFPTVGFDIDRGRIEQLRGGFDRTDEIGSEVLAASQLTLTADEADCRGADVYIVTVPTPVDVDNRPDLTLLRLASQLVGRLIEGSSGSIVVFESTVYPGVTEDVCGPIIAQISGLVSGRDFFLGYSPERINPGDREHTVDRITKVVAGETPAITERLCAIYGAITTGGTFPAASIRVAEAAKVIENAQRDINIAFINEVTQIFAKLDLSIWDVLAAARTKWNFLPFQPGLVGGHCIGVDPYYLSHCAEQLGHTPAVILAGRTTNDAMADWVAGELCRDLGENARILILGLTFKENVPDLRNSKVAQIVTTLRGWGHSVSVHDPLANAVEAKHEHGVDLLPTIPDDQFDAVLLAVAHDAYRLMPPADLAALVRSGGVFGDLKDIVPDDAAFVGKRRWRL